LTGSVPKVDSKEKLCQHGGPLFPVSGKRIGETPHGKKRTILQKKTCLQQLKPEDRGADNA